MKSIWMRKAKSFSEAYEHEMEYYRKMGSKKRLETVQFLREQHRKIVKVNDSESREGLRRVVRVVQQT